MSIEGLQEEDLKHLELELLNKVPETGSIGNVSLIDGLKWDEEKYWFIRNRLIDQGILEKGKGKGGSVRKIIVVETQNDESSESGKTKETRITENELYEPLAKVIKEKWVIDHRVDTHVVEITAKQGARETGGKWSRPDITVASYTTYTYVPGKFFDVITFEIKPMDAIDVTAVYEALAHRRAATRSYVILHVPDDIAINLESVVVDICEEAKKHGIGVIVVDKPDDYETWDERVEAGRFEPDPSKLNDFLSKQVSLAFKEQIIRWFR